MEGSRSKFKKGHVTRPRPFPGTSSCTLLTVVEVEVPTFALSTDISRGSENLKGGPVTLVNPSQNERTHGSADVMGVCIQYLVVIGLAVIAPNRRTDRQTDIHCSNYER